MFEAVVAAGAEAVEDSWAAKDFVDQGTLLEVQISLHSSGEFWMSSMVDNII